MSLVTGRPIIELSPQEIWDQLNSPDYLIAKASLVGARLNFTSLSKSGTLQRGTTASIRCPVESLALRPFLGKEAQLVASVTRHDETAMKAGFEVRGIRCIGKLAVSYEVMPHPVTDTFSTVSAEVSLGRLREHAVRPITDLLPDQTVLDDWLRQNVLPGLHEAA